MTYIPLEVKQPNSKIDCSTSFCKFFLSLEHLHVFVFISVSLHVRHETGADADNLLRGEGVCEGERQGSLAVLLCFAITALSELRMGTV